MLFSSIYRDLECSGVVVVSDVLGTRVFALSRCSCGRVLVGFVVSYGGRRGASLSIL